MLMGAMPLGAPAHADTTGQDYTIVIISSEDSLQPFHRAATDAFVSRLRQFFDGDLTIMTELMQSSRRPEGLDEDAFAARLQREYSGEKVDLVFTLGPQALTLFVHKK